MSDEYISYLQSLRGYILSEGYKCMQDIKYLEGELRAVDFELSELNK